MRRGSCLVAACLLGCSGSPQAPCAVAQPRVATAPSKPELILTGHPDQSEPLELPGVPRQPPKGRWLLPASVGIYLEKAVAMVAPLSDEEHLFRVANPSGKAWACASVSPSRRYLLARDEAGASLWRYGDTAPLLSAAAPPLDSEALLGLSEGRECAVSWSAAEDVLLFRDQVWQLKAGKIVTLDPESSGCSGLSPSGRYIQTCEPAMKLLRASDLKPLLELPANDGWAEFFGAQDQLVAVRKTTADATHSEVWDVVKRRRLLTTDKLVIGFSPDGRFVNLRTPLPVRESHVVELASKRTLAVLQLGWTACGSGSGWSADSRYYGELDDYNIHVLDVQRKTHKLIPSLGSESCGEDSLTVNGSLVATGQRLFRFDPFGVLGRFQGAAEGVPSSFSPGGRYLSSRLDQEAPRVAVYGAIPFESQPLQTLEGEHGWLRDAPVLALVAPQKRYWELASPVERVRIRIEPMDDAAGVPTCLSVVREDNVADGKFCPHGVTPPDRVSESFDGRDLLAITPGVLSSFLETARRGYLTAPLIPPP